MPKRLIAVHGWGHSGCIWNDLLPGEDTVHVFRPTIPGFDNRSPIAPLPSATDFIHTVGEQIAREWTEATGQRSDGQPDLVIGHSLGALVALSMPYECPRLLFCAPLAGLKLMLRASPCLLVIRQILAARRHVPDRLKQRASRCFNEKLTSGPTSFPVEAIQAGVNMDTSTAILGLNAIRRWRPPTTRPLPEFELVLGARDPVVPLNRTISLAESLGGNIQVWNTVGHVPMLERRNAAAALVRDRL